MTLASLNNLYVTAVRGIYKAIAFDSALFPKFVESGTTTKLTREKVVKEFPDKTFNTQIILKPVLEFAKTYYNCTTLEGMPLENKSINETQWEKAVAANDIMGSAGYSNPALSNLTLSFMEGTGWFKPDYEKQEVFIWGKGAGCDLFTADCAKMKYTCKEKDKMCSSDFTTTGICEKDEMAEACPFFHEDKKGDCRYSDNLDKASGVAKSLFYGPGARCIEGKIGFEKIA